MIDIRPDHLEIVRDILRRCVPGAEVRAFGSRAAGNAKGWSDLDIAVSTEEKLPLRTLSELKSAFEDSDLPFRVDILDWFSISDEFKKQISGQLIVLQERSQQSTSS